MRYPETVYNRESFMYDEPGIALYSIKNVMPGPQEHPGDMKMECFQPIEKHTLGHRTL